MLCGDISDIHALLLRHANHRFAINLGRAVIGGWPGWQSAPRDRPRALGQLLHARAAFGFPDRAAAAAAAGSPLFRPDGRCLMPPNVIGPSAVRSAGLLRVWPRRGRHRRAPTPCLGGLGGCQCAGARLGAVGRAMGAPAARPAMAQYSSDRDGPPGLPKARQLRSWCAQWHLLSANDYFKCPLSQVSLILRHGPKLWTSSAVLFSFKWNCSKRAQTTILLLRPISLTALPLFAAQERTKSPANRRNLWGSTRRSIH